MTIPKTAFNACIGKITDVKADALITMINSEEQWFSRADWAIRESSGVMFHSVAAEAMPLADGQIIYAPATDDHNGRFNAVIFVVDDLLTPLYNLVVEALLEAERGGLRSVSIAPPRTDCKLDDFEIKATAVRSLSRAVRYFAQRGSCIERIDVVFPEDLDDRVRLLHAFVTA